MRHSLNAIGLAAVLLLGTMTNAQADSKLDAQIKDSLQNKKLSQIQALAKSDKANIDAIVKGLLDMTQARIASDPAYTNKMMAMAGDYAPNITPPTVPVVCADLRRIVEALPESQQGSDLHTTIIATTQNFASSPVVVSAGRPNLCEDAWLQASNLTGEPLLFMNPGMRSPGLPPVTIGPTIPPGRNPKASGD